MSETLEQRALRIWSWVSQDQPLDAQICELVSRLTTAATQDAIDAARYRWLRTKDGDGPALLDDWDMDGAEPEELDAAIDAEIAKAAA